jgi:hypothetical protein
MVRYACHTGIKIGDPTVVLIDPKRLDFIEERVDKLRESGGTPWISSATWTDPTNWDTQAKKPKLWKDIKGHEPNSTPWGRFVDELSRETTYCRGLILKTFSQDSSYKILNIRMQPGSIWKHPYGWSMHVEWLETTDAREGDETIPRSFMITSDPELSVICGESTRQYAQKFLNNSRYTLTPTM